MNIFSDAMTFRLRHLAALACLLNVPALALPGQHQLRVATRDFRSDADARPRNGMQVNYSVEAALLSKFSIAVEDEWYLSQKSLEDRNAYGFNSLSAKLWHSGEASFYKLQYRHRFYQPSKTQDRRIAGIISPVKQRFVNNTYLAGERLLGPLRLEGWAQLRNLHYDLYDTLFSSKAPAQENDLFLSLRAHYPVAPGLSAFAGGAAKDDLSDSKTYDLSQWSAGLGYDRKFNPFTMLSAETGYYHSISGALPADREHIIQSSLRLQKWLGNDLAGMVCADQRLSYSGSRFRTVAYQVRTNLKYSYRSNRYADSYLGAMARLGRKHTSVAGLDVKQNLFFSQRAFVTAGFRSYFDSERGRFSGGFTFHLNPADYLFVTNEYYQFAGDVYTDVLNAGLALFF